MRELPVCEDVATGCDLFQLESDNKVEDIQLSGDGRMVVFGGKIREFVCVTNERVHYPRHTC